MNVPEASPKNTEMINDLWNFDLSTPSKKVEPTKHVSTMPNLLDDLDVLNAADLTD